MESRVGNLRSTWLKAGDVEKKWCVYRIEKISGVKTISLLTKEKTYT